MDISSVALVGLWLAASWAFGHAMLPFSRRVLGVLPDGGLAAGRVLGLVLLGLIAFELASLHLASLQLSPIFMLALPLWMWWKHRSDAEFHSWKRQRRRDLWISDGVFALAFLAFGWLRWRNPALGEFEKPMDIALLASAARASWVPFENPWFAGESFTNYYYFGPLLGGIVARTLATPAHLAYNLVQPLFCALFVSTLCALGASVTRSWWRGAWIMSIIALWGHFEPLRQSAKNGVSPLSPSSLNWWDTSRVIKDTINEYPFFTLVLGDAHAHFYALSLSALLFCLCWNLFHTAPSTATDTQIEGNRSPITRSNTDSILSFAAELLPVPSARISPAFAVAEGRMFSARKTKSKQICPESPTLQPTNAPQVLAEASTPQTSAIFQSRHLTLLCGGALLGALVLGNTWDAPLSALLLMGCAWFSSRRSSEWRRELCWSLSPLLIAPVLALPYLRLFRAQVQGAAWELWFPAPLEWAMLWGAMFVLWSIVALSMAIIWRRKQNLSGEENSFQAFWMLLSACGIVALFAPNFFYIRGFFEGDLRHQDTVFKFGLQAWLMLGLAATCGAWWLLNRLSRTVQVLAASAWALLWLVPICCSGAMIYGRAINVPAEKLSLNGASHLSRSDARAMEWLGANAPANSVVLEAVKPGRDFNSYSEFGRIAALSGVPTPLGWTQHVWYWGANLDTQVWPRHDEIEAIWQNFPVTRDLREKLGVTHIFVGDTERRTYTPAQLKSVLDGCKVLFQDGETLVLQPK